MYVRPPRVRTSRSFIFRLQSVQNFLARFPLPVLIPGRNGTQYISKYQEVYLGVYSASDAHAHVQEVKSIPASIRPSLTRREQCALRGAGTSRGRGIRHREKIMDQVYLRIHTRYTRWTARNPAAYLHRAWTYMSTSSPGIIRWGWQVQGRSFGEKNGIQNGSPHRPRCRLVKKSWLLFAAQDAFLRSIALWALK